MKNLPKTHNSPGAILLIAIMFIVSSSSGQQIKPSNSGYAPVNGINVYYEVYGEGRPLVLLHGAFFTIEMNWAQTIPELRPRRVDSLRSAGGTEEGPHAMQLLVERTLERAPGGRA